MHINAKPPALASLDAYFYMDKLSKAALMDLVWSLAGQTVESAEDNTLVMGKIREEWDIVKKYRK